MYSPCHETYVYFFLILFVWFHSRFQLEYPVLQQCLPFGPTTLRSLAQSRSSSEDGERARLYPRDTRYAYFHRVPEAVLFRCALQKGGASIIARSSSRGFLPGQFFAMWTASSHIGFDVQNSNDFHVAAYRLSCCTSGMVLKR